MKRLIRTLIGALGYDIRRRRPEGWDPAYLKQFGRPATVFDVGACCGTRRLYEAFPNAYHVLIEPISECKTELDQILSEFKGCRVETALGARPGSAELHVPPLGVRSMSTLLRPSRSNTDLSGLKLTPRTVPVTTLDHLARERGLRGPFGIKIDTEGYELEVLRGATGVLAETEFVIVEIGMMDRFEGSYTFADLVTEMDRRGFKLADILEIFRSGPRILYMDGVFIKK